LEDRLLKKQFQQWAREGKAKILTKHVMKPTAAEVNANAASRSAKLRLVEMQ
jgi:16S rRNA (cytosine1402-N4)-methyltransferase